MALAAGRITSQDVSPYSEDYAATRPRLAYPPAVPTGSDDPPAVVVTRAHLISDHPPATDIVGASATSSRPSRRARADSEDFETLDLEDTEGDVLRLDPSAPNQPPPGNVTSLTGDTGVRVSRTPPPPPAQTPPRRMNTGQLGPAAGGQRPGPPPPPPPTASTKKAPSLATSGSTTPSGSTGSAPRARGKKRAWWEVLFSDDYVKTLPRPSAGAVAKQVSFMEASLGIKRGDAVLDVGCGLGQHALEFARRGYLVVALDLALSMITRAAEEAQQRGLRINFLHKDIRDIGFEGTFDAIVCVGTTFGFFDDEQNRGVITRLAHALKPGGRLLLEVVNRDFVIASQPNLVWFEGDGCVVMEESDFNFYSSRLTVKRTMMRDDGRQSDTEYNIRLYSVHELGQMLKHAGFSIKEVSGQEATRGMFFGAQSSRIIILAERRARGRKDSIGAPPSNHQG
jgi:SAM-dependent methyltransferase